MLTSTSTPTREMERERETGGGGYNPYYYTLDLLTNFLVCGMGMEY
jgi:hypothetical protein